MKGTRSWKKTAQRFRVPVGTVLGVVFLAFMHPSVRSLWIGGALAVAGGLWRLWAAGYIEKGRVLAQGGPYAFSRNPLYVGSFVMALGVILAGQGYWLLPFFLAFFLVFYLPVMRAEEGDLQRTHGERFLRYADRVPLFFPRWSGARGDGSTFLWSRVVRNREHRNSASLLVVLAILVGRLWLERYL
ncbi:MAG: isoprenylcysteine carboxylmethyltransferase family protein [Acidobacteria bacterium]|nr:isoprenylcysteine carboxylmethyltransferase family protein [Acidobacteriota bacterium]